MSKRNKGLLAVSVMFTWARVGNTVRFAREIVIDRHADLGKRLRARFVGEDRYGRGFENRQDSGDDRRRAVQRNNKLPKRS